MFSNILPFRSTQSLLCASATIEMHHKRVWNDWQAMETMMGTRIGGTGGTGMSYFIAVFKNDYSLNIGGKWYDWFHDWKKWKMVKSWLSFR